MAQKYSCRNSTNRWLGKNLINYSCLRLKQQARGGGRGRRTLTWRPADSVLGEGGHGKGEAGAEGPGRQRSAYLSRRSAVDTPPTHEKIQRRRRRQEARLRPRREEDTGSKCGL